MPTNLPPAAAPDLDYVKRVRRGERVWLYYRRAGRRWPLPGPEGSAVFLAAYNRIHASYATLRDATPAGTPGTIDAAVTLYLGSADYQRLAEKTRRDYRQQLDRFRGAFGPLYLRDLDTAWWEALRDKHAAAPIAWNNLRMRMRDVIAMYRKRFPALCPDNPLAEVKRLRVRQSDQNRAWPEEVLAATMAGATPQFRALLVGYLLTAQRGGDVTGWTRDQYDEASRTITMRQGKTGTPLVLHVPRIMAAMIKAQPVQHPDYLFCTPRGVRWKLPNAQETLARLLRQLGLPRYTLHGLRATGPTALVRAGRPNRQGRDLTGHGSDSSFEVYVRGAASFESRRDAQQLLETLFGRAIAGAEASGNARRFTGVTGRASAKARPAGVATGVETGNSPRRTKSRKPAEV